MYCGANTHFLGFFRLSGIVVLLASFRDTPFCIEPMKVDETEQAVKRSREGDMDAFGQLIRMHEGWVRGFLRARIRDWASADDLAQDVFVTAFRRLKEYRGEARFESWLRGIALNHLRNFLRKRREECIGGSEELQTLLDTEHVEEVESGGRELDALRDCLQRIDGPSRELLDRRYVNGDSVRDLAASTGRGYSALTMQLHRMREMLAECVKRKLEFSES